MNKYSPPVFKKTGFHCPHCGIKAHQYWSHATHTHSGTVLKGISSAICFSCENYSLWLNEKIIYPRTSSAPLPSEDMPQDVKDDFLEARNIVDSSPRAAAALLRLAIQKLMVEVGEKGKNLNEDIGSLVNGGKLVGKVQKALDSVRVIGNNAVHPGRIDLKDDINTAIILFELVNMIVETIITEEKKVNAIFNKLPNGAKAQIKKRNNNP